MRRRKLLRTAGGIGVAATAGCLGYTVESEEDVAARKTEIANKQATIDEQQSEIADLEGRVDELNATIEERESRIADLESTQADNEDEIARLEGEVADLRLEKLSEVYLLGYVAFNDGQEARENGDTDREEGDYDYAVGFYLRANGHFRSASSAFERAQAVLDRMSDPPDVADILEESISTTESYARASVNYGSYCLLMDNGNESDAESYKQSGDTALSNAESGTVVSAGQFDEELGL